MGYLSGLQIGFQSGLSNSFVSKFITVLAKGGADWISQGFQSGLIAGNTPFALSEVAGASTSNINMWNNMLVLSTLTALLVISAYFFYLGFNKVKTNSL